MTDYSNTPRDATRVPLAHRIQLKFDRFSGFINEYVSNISPGGIFIRTDSPEPPGQLLEFEFRLGDGFELIHGRGEVVWSRQRGDGPERPPGMGVRFLDLSPGSKDLIYKIVDDYVAHGGKPFDLTPPSPPAAAVATRAPGDPAGAPSAAPGGAPAGAPGGVPGGAPAGAPGGAPGGAAAGQAAGVPSGSPSSPPVLPWTLDLPPIQPLPGVPAITPRSPLESLGAGGAYADDFEVAARPEAGARAAAGQAMDPLARMAAALPPLDDLAPDVPGLLPVPAPQQAPAFSSFEPRVPVRRSRLPLIAALVAIGLLALAAFLARDYLLGWLEKREQAQAERTPLAPLTAPSRPPAARGTAGAMPAGAAAATVAAPGAAAFAAAAGAAGQPVAPPAAPGAPPGKPETSAGVPGGESSPPPLVTARTTPGTTPGAAPGAAPGATPGAAPGSAPAERATAVERITWEASPGATDVVLWGNGDFVPQSYTRTRVTGSPVREVVRITGITRPFPSPRLAVRTPELLQVRTGFHPPQELHVVLDLGGRDVAVSAVEAGPRQLRIHLRSR